jgi:uncharacterized protein (DUF1800 family)
MKLLSNSLKKVFAAVAIYAVLMPAGVLAAGGASDKKGLTDDQKILHVLNRLGFGARPGDVEKVKAIGLQKYIEQQLNPSSIDDRSAEAKVKNLEIFNMTTAEVFAKYPNPGALLRQLEGGRQAQAAKQQQAQADKPAGNDQADQEMTEAQRRERQQKLNALYREYNLRPANQLMPQIAANRILRAAYSERQLQEVMVDFWQNHFNVFAGKAAVRWYIPSYERDVLRKNALGNFKDLLIGTAQHPAMLFYLDNFESVSPNSKGPGNGQQAERLRELLASGRELPPRMRERLKRQYGVNDAELDTRLDQMRKNPPTA